MTGKSKKPESVKLAVTAKSLAGQSERQIAAETGIHRSAVHNIVEEAKVNMRAAMARRGWGEDFFLDKLAPLFDANKVGLYGVSPDGPTRLGAIRLATEWAGVTEGNEAEARKPGGNPVCLVVADEARAARIARLLSDRRGTNVVIDLDAKVDTNLGRA